MVPPPPRSPSALPLSSPATPLPALPPRHPLVAIVKEIFHRVVSVPLLSSHLGLSRSFHSRISPNFLLSWCPGHSKTMCSPVSSSPHSGQSSRGRGFFGSCGPTCVGVLCSNGTRCRLRAPGCPICVCPCRTPPLLGVSPLSPGSSL